MADVLPFLIVGAVTGSVYAIAAMGLVLSYKTSGVFNFAHGSIAALAAGVFYALHIEAGLPWPLAGLLSVLACGLVFGLLLERLGELLATVGTTMKIVATVGLMVSLSAVIPLWFGPAARPFPQYLPQGTFQVASVYVGDDQLIIVVLGALVAVYLTLLFRRTLLGKQMQAVVDDPVLLRLAGTSSATVRRWSWIMGCTFASLSGVLIAPALGLDNITLTLLVVQCLGAAAFGRFASIGWTYVGGLVLGIGGALATRYALDIPALDGLSSSLAFIVLFVVIVSGRRGRLVEVGASLQRRISAAQQGGLLSRSIKTGMVVLGAVLVPFVAPAYLASYTLAVVYLIVFFSLSLLLRTANLVSLSQISFVAIGAVSSHWLMTLSIPWPLAVLGAALIALPFGAVIGIPAIRVTGVYLALATLGFGILLQQYLYSSNLMFGKSTTPIDAPRPSFAADDLRYYFLMVCIAALCYVVVRAVERGRLGRLLRARADSERALVASGASPSLTPVLVFCISAGLAGLGGALLGPVFGSIGAGSVQTFPQSALMVTLLMLASRNPRLGTLGACVVAALAMMVVPAYIRDGATLQWLNLTVGILALEAAIASTGTSWLSLDFLLRRRKRLIAAGEVQADEFVEASA